MDVDGSLTYTQSTTAANRVKDRVGNDATSPQTIAYTAWTADTTGPLSQDIRISTSAGFAGLLDTGDIFTVAFNEAMGPAAPAAGSKIRLTDADGSVYDVICGTNATCSAPNGAAVTIGGVSYPTGTVITVTLIADPTLVTAGTVAGLALPATVIDAGGFTDTAGNQWNVAGSPDKILN